MVERMGNDSSSEARCSAHIAGAIGRPAWNVFSNSFGALMIEFGGPQLAYSETRDRRLVRISKGVSGRGAPRVRVIGERSLCIESPCTLLWKNHEASADKTIEVQALGDICHILHSEQLEGVSLLSTSSAIVTRFEFGCGPLVVEGRNHASKHHTSFDWTLSTGLVGDRTTVRGGNLTFAEAGSPPAAVAPDRIRLPVRSQTV